MSDPKPPLDPSRVKRYPLAERKSKVSETALAKEPRPGMSMKEWLDTLPDLLAARDFKTAVKAIAQARQNGRPVLVGMGAHPVKTGLSPVIIKLMEERVITGLAMNGAVAVHDFEMALIGRTSEEVGPALDDGSFGMAEETGKYLNQAAARCLKEEIGLGRAIGEMLLSRNPPHLGKSLLAAAARLDVPATIHVAIGTDIVHMHPEADGSAIGKGSHRDFLIFAAQVAELEGGVYLNLGSAVVMPEVFLKALSLARNLGNKVECFTTVNMDFLRHYRPAVNVVERPARTGGRGINLTGHHEIMFPLLAAAVMEELAGQSGPGGKT